MSLIEDDPPDAPGSGANTPEFTVSELSRGVKRTLEGAFGHVRVRGELGRVTFHRNGHVYLDLKDENAVLAGVVWKSAVRALEIRPQEGDEVIATGRITTFAGQSKYQLVIEALAYAGEGALLAKLERLKKALAAEGLFADDRKRPLPYLPRTIGVVTSPTGAVIRDILHRLAERFPLRVLVWPVAVQGPSAAGQVSEAIRGFNRLPTDGPVPRPDLLIIARGGGSIEDLWGFNEEAVVRAAAASDIPLISAVGHETDTTLIDFAADRRAPTPTAAAEMAVPVRAELAATLAELEARRLRALTRMLETKRRRLADMTRALPRPTELVELRRQRLAARHLPDPRRLVETARARLALPAGRLRPALEGVVNHGRLELTTRTGRLSPLRLRDRTKRSRQEVRSLALRLPPAIQRLIRGLREQSAASGRLLESLSEARTLARGFAIVRGRGGTVATRAAAIAPGAALDLHFADGHVSAQAKGGAPSSLDGATPLKAPGKPTAPRRGKGSKSATGARQPSLFDET
ncbi:MAG: exodeoxyribonuclease VII large subunit [Pseudomonadota bacterium]